MTTARRQILLVFRITVMAAAACAILVGLPIPRNAPAQEVTQVFVVPAHAVSADSVVSVWLAVLNTADRAVTHTFPSTLQGRLSAGGIEQPVTLALRTPADGAAAVIPPGGYLRREYVLTIPPGIVGKAAFHASGVQANPVVVEVVPAVAMAQTDAKPEGAAVAEGAAVEKTRSRLTFDPEEFFREHFFGYEPLYFIAGTEQPNAKFQISFRYQFLNSNGPLVRRYPWLKGFSLAYSQTSLWDWGEPSSPFYDTSYRPEFLYLMQRVDEGRWADWFRLDLQAGIKHESNGQDEEDSRTLNIAYFEPTMRFGREDGLQLSIAPRVWAYVGSLSDNPDMAYYRGYVGLRSVVGWTAGWQLAAIGRLGNEGNRGSIQLDLSYPLMKVLFGNSSLYFQAQYFYGYGESLISYNERGSSFRVGFALYR
jgi:outer membrane phospholipase A